MPDQQSDGSAPAGVEFSESFVEADGFRIRYRQAGSGEVLIYLHGGGGLRISRAHELLAHSRRLIAFEIPGSGQSPVNDRSASMEELAGTMNAAVAALGIDHYSIMGNSFGSKVALWMAILRPQVVKAVVVVGPAAIRLPRQGPPPGQLAPERAAELLYARPSASRRFHHWRLKSWPSRSRCPRDCLVRPAMNPSRLACASCRCRSWLCLVLTIA